MFLCDKMNQWLARSSGEKLKNLLLAAMNILCLHFSAKSMPAGAEDFVCRGGGGFFVFNFLVKRKMELQ